MQNTSIKTRIINMELRTTAGLRLKALRTLIGMTQKDFSAFIHLPLPRYKGIEVMHTRVAEDVFAIVCSKLPAFTDFVVYEGKISLKRLESSDSEFEKLAAARYVTRTLPPNNIIVEFLNDDRQKS